jgi:hypothetical protein
MSVLYLGPYRQTDTNGQISRYFLNSLVDEYGKKYVISRPIYLDNITSLLSKNIAFDTEISTELSNKHCVCVQHMPIAHMQYMPDIADHHYAFPVLDTIDSFGIAKSQLDILLYFNKVIVQSELEKNTLSKNCPGIADRIHIFEPKINKKQYKKICEKKYSFKNYDSVKKLYYIGNMDTDESTIKKILFSLYSATLKNTISPICIFYLDFITKPDIKSLDNNIKQMRLDFGMPENQSKEIFIFKHFSEEDLIIAHNSCDIYLSINENQTQYIHQKYAQLSGNTIIDLDKIYDTTIPYKTPEFSYSMGLTKRYVSVSKLSETIKSII